MAKLEGWQRWIRGLALVSGLVVSGAVASSGLQAMREGLAQMRRNLEGLQQSAAEQKATFERYEVALTKAKADEQALVGMLRLGAKGFPPGTPAAQVRRELAEAEQLLDRTRASIARSGPLRDRARAAYRDAKVQVLRTQQEIEVSEQLYASAARMAGVALESLETTLAAVEASEVGPLVAGRHPEVLPPHLRAGLDEPGAYAALVDAPDAAVLEALRTHREFGRVTWIAQYTAQLGDRAAAVQKIEAEDRDPRYAGISARILRTRLAEGRPVDPFQQAWLYLYQEQGFSKSGAPPGDPKARAEKYGVRVPTPWPPRIGPVPAPPPAPAPASPPPAAARRPPPPPEDFTGVRWDETPTHRIKTRYANGQVVGRWQFRKKP